MLRVAVCDDNPDHLSEAKRRTQEVLTRENQSFKIWPFTSAEFLLERITEEDWQPDIAVLDIEMEGKDGITLAQELNQKVPQCRIIFLTSYLDYAPEVYIAEHIWFVVKNRADEFLDAAMKKALVSLEQKETPVPGLLVREDGKKILVPMTEILYISRVARKAHVHCMDRDYYDPRKPAELIPESLKDSFLRCHQGYWVNVKMIEELDHEEFILRGGIRIPIGRRHRDEARGRFLKKFQV